MVFDCAHRSVLSINDKNLNSEIETVSGIVEPHYNLFVVLSMIRISILRLKLIGFLACPPRDFYYQ